MSKLAIDAYLKEAFKRNKSAQTHVEVHKRAVELIRRCWAENVFIVFTDGLRTMEDQAVLYGKGRSNYVYGGKQYGNPKEKKVSNAKPGSSYHNYGLALDFVTCDGYGKNIDWVVGPKWKRAAAIAKELGFVWGGDWKSFYDAPHIEYSTGITVEKASRGVLPSFKPFKAIVLGEQPKQAVEAKQEATMKQYKALEEKIQLLTNELAALKEAIHVNKEVLGASHEEAWFWAKENGLFNGQDPSAHMTRQQAATVFKRYDELLKK